MDANTSLMNKRGHSNEPLWALTRQLDGQPERVFAHASGDVQLIANMIWSEVMGTSMQGASGVATTTVGEHPALNKAAEGQKQPKSINRRTMSRTFSHVQGQTMAVSLAGDLREINLMGVLQSIAICKMTGRLDVRNFTQQAEIYFADGQLADAKIESVLETNSQRSEKGEEAVIDVLTWDSGQFSFQHGRRSSNRTIQKMLEQILLEGACLMDYTSYLKAQGFTPDSAIYCTFSGIDQTSLLTKLGNGVPVELPLQEAIYRDIEAGKRVSDVIADRNMPKRYWIPIVFNLLNSGVVTMAKPEQEISKSKKKGAFNEDVIRQQSSSLLRPETSLMGYDLFLYLLSNEIARHKNTKLPFALLACEVKIDGNAPTNQMLRVIADTFRAMSADFDLIAHYQTSGFLILWPARGAHEAQTLSEKFANMILKRMAKETGDRHVEIRIGIAVAPQAGQDLETLINAAVESRAQGQDTPINISLANAGGDARMAFLERLAMQAQNAENQADIAQSERLWWMCAMEADRLPRHEKALEHSLEKLIEMMAASNSIDIAEPILKTLLSIKEKDRQNDHGLVETLDRLAQCYYMQNRMDDAEQILLRLVGIYEEAAESNPLRLAACLYNLASVYHLQQRDDIALTYYEMVVEMRLELLGEEHPDTIKARRNVQALRPPELTNREVDPGLITGSWKTVNIELEEQLKPQ
jgi:GGDEF domain-containing protein